MLTLHWRCRPTAELTKSHQPSNLLFSFVNSPNSPYLAFKTAPLPSNRHHPSNGDCLVGKRENQVCCVQYCVQQLCTVQCTHIWTELTVLWIGFCLTGPISLCLDSFYTCRPMYVFSVCLYIACMCSIVTWWGGPGGIEAWSLGLLKPFLSYRPKPPKL